MLCQKVSMENDLESYSYEFVHSPGWTWSHLGLISANYSIGSDQTNLSSALKLIGLHHLRINNVNLKAKCCV